jgi:hypothetical protein
MPNDTLNAFVAPRLQYGKEVMNLKRWIVGLLAVVALGGCGVGVDDPEGQQAAGKTGQGLTPGKGGNVTAQSASHTSAEMGATTNNSMGNDGTTYLPQDPVPLFIIHGNNPDDPNGGMPH